MKIEPKYSSTSTPKSVHMIHLVKGHRYRLEERGWIGDLTFIIGLNKCGIKLQFKISSTQNLNKLGSPIAPTTYDKQDNELCDSKIYNVKHQDHHKVNCISKGENNRDTQRRWCILKFTLSDATLRWSGMEAQGSPNATEAQRILLEPSHQKGSSRSTMGPLIAVTKSIQAWGNLHNLIGGSQVIHKATKLRRSPQLN
jgi:hypothetical protein